MTFSSYYRKFLLYNMYRTQNVEWLSLMDKEMNENIHMK